MKKILSLLYAFLAFSLPLALSYGNTIPLSHILNENGDLNLHTGEKGNLMITGFSANIDDCKGLVFSPTENPPVFSNDWEPLGTGTNGAVFSVALDGMGNLYAAGLFTTAGGISASRIAKWDGTSWSALGSGLNGVCNAVVVDFAGNVIAGGGFTTAGGISANRIAKWNGSTWSAMGSGFDNECIALGIHPNGDLYAGGLFGTAGGVAVNFIARWNGSTWSSLGSGLGAVFCFTLAIDWQGNVYAGGAFTTAGGVPANRIAKWNGSTWSALGSGFDDTCNAVAVDQNGNVYAGGRFTTAGGVPALRAAKWDGTSWSALGDGLSDFSHYMIIDQNGDLIAGGRFASSGGQFVGWIARWDGSSWNSVGGGTNGTVQGIAEDPMGNLYVGGWFGQAGGMPANGVAKFINSVTLNTYYQDADADGFGNSSVSTQAQFPPLGYVNDNTDCDDTQASVNPTAEEICDGYDNDCDGSVDEGFDFDNDGISDCTDNCPFASNHGQEDADCDGKGDVCDYCNGGDDTIDNNQDGYPDCDFYPGFPGLTNDWKCSNGTRVTLCYVRSTTDINTICIHPSSVQTYLLARPLSYVGPCNNASCGQAKTAGTKNNSNGLQLFEPFQIVGEYQYGNLEILLDEILLDKSVRLSLFDILGRPVWNVNLKHLDASSVLLNPSEFNLNNGMYFLYLDAGEIHFSKPVVIQKR